MAQYRRNYEYGTAAREYYGEPVRKEYEEKRIARRPKKASAFNIRGAIIVAIAFAVFAFVMVNYVRLQSELTGTVKTVARKEIELNKLTTANDEHYARVISSVDLAEIENIARGELGMGYAGEGQIITYISTNNDYMRRTDSGN